MSLPYEAARNGLGQPLSAESRAKLDAVIATPNHETWDAAHTVIITANGITLWQAVRAVDESYQGVRRLDEMWEKIPASFTLRRALQRAASGEL